MNRFASMHGGMSLSEFSDKHSVIDESLRSTFSNALESSGATAYPIMLFLAHFRTTDAEASLRLWIPLLERALAHPDWQVRIN
jgi:hypothetical protein